MYGCTYFVSVTIRQARVHVLGFLLSEYVYNLIIHCEHECEYVHTIIHNYFKLVIQFFHNIIKSYYCTYKGIAHDYCHCFVPSNISSVSPLLYCNRRSTFNKLFTNYNKYIYYTCYNIYVLELLREHILELMLE